MMDVTKRFAESRANPECLECHGGGLVTIQGRSGYCACTAAVPVDLPSKELERIEDRLLDASTSEEVRETMATCGVSPEECQRLEKEAERDIKQLKFFMKLLGAQRRRMVQHMTEAAERVELIQGNTSARLRAFVRIFATLEGVVPNPGKDD